MLEVILMMKLFIRCVAVAFIGALAVSAGNVALGDTEPVQHGAITLVVGLGTFPIAACARWLNKRERIRVLRRCGPYWPRPTRI